MAQFLASPAARPAKASREKVFGAADEILRAGRRPTIEAIQARLGGGSPNSVVAYVNQWYAELGERLARTETPAEGLTPEVHRAALLLQAALARQVASGAVGETTETLIRSMRAEILSLQTLVEELRGQRGRDQQQLANARALLVRKDEDLQAHHASQLSLQAALAVAEDRLQQLAVARAPSPRRKRPKAAGKVGARRASRGRKAALKSKAGKHLKPSVRRAPSSGRTTTQSKVPVRRRARTK
jgi:hypothetical protein